MPPPTLDELIFPSQANHTNLSRILGDLKRSNLSIANRLRSICHDAAFVDRVADELGLPLVANERCGSWYIDPVRKAGSAYFKSTDGHTGQWKFSLRRLNLHLLGLVGEAGGWVFFSFFLVMFYCLISIFYHFILLLFFETPVLLPLKTNHPPPRCIIVDSTRRGKPMPDALTKTLPTWCAVLNQARMCLP